MGRQLAVQVKIKLETITIMCLVHLPISVGGEGVDARQETREHASILSLELEMGMRALSRAPRLACDAVYMCLWTLNWIVM